MGIKMSIKEIEDIFKNTPMAELPDRIAEYEPDDRGGVQKILEKYRKRIAAREKERERLKEMFYFEEKYRSDCPVICGIDEAGRGPLCGPVVAGAVILPADILTTWEDPEGMMIEGLNDSKQVSEKRREALYEEITAKTVSYGVGVIPPARIDEINILQATYEAMRLAVQDLSQVPDLLLNDAVTIPELPIRQAAIIKGDSRSLSIAAASIIAKVTRDRMMFQYAEMYPAYHFEKNKGYGTADHIQALKEHGPCAIHRLTFIGNFI